MMKAYKYRMYLNIEQKIYFSKVFGCTRFVYNKMLADKIEYYNTYGKSLYITPAQYKKDYEWLKEVDSLALANASIHLETAFKNFFRDKKIGFPKFKSKKNRNSYTTNNQNGTIKVENDKIKLPKIGEVKIKQHREIKENAKIKSATISRNAKGEYYVSVLVEYENQVQEVDIKNVIGLDYSMQELYVTSNGEEAKYPKFYRKSEQKLKQEQRRLSHMKKTSNNFEKQKRKIAKIYIKIANQRKDFLHKLSRKLERTYDAVCIENLNMKEMSQKSNYGLSVHDNGWGMFITFLEYKLKESGKKLIKIDTYFPSSQLCNVCGYQNKEVKNLSIRKWKCPECKTFHDRDINAARNIKNEGMRLAIA